MKSHFLLGPADFGGLSAALTATLPGQTEPWVLWAEAGDPLAYFNIEPAFGVQVDISGRHFFEDAAVLTILEQVRSRVGGEIVGDDDPRCPN